MPTREEIEVKDRADRALRAGRAREALGLYTALLGRVQVFEPGIYESWLEGALAAYQALGRRREAGYVLLGLRRFLDAQRLFPAGEWPLEWALCASKLGRYGEAARVLSAAGHPALAAVELENGGVPAAARVEWERALENPRLEGRVYETALVHFSLGEVLLKLGERAAGERELALTQRLLEELADEFESRGDRERAFDCFGILLRLGKDTGSFENVAEGYLNAIRVLAADDQKFYVLQYYDDFLAYAVERGEHYAAATLAREVADYCAKTGLVYDRHYLQRAAGLWSDAARQNETAGGPPDLTENALHAGIDAATALGDLGLVARLYGELAALPLPEKKRNRYQALARRYASGGVPPPPPVGFPEYLRRPGAYQDVWRQDVVEWELDGDPVAVLARLVVDRTDHARFSRLALRALLVAGGPSFSTADPTAASDLAMALGRIQVYEVLRPLEKLFEQEAPQVRAAVMLGAGQVYCKRTFGLVRRGLGDEAAGVREEALKALRGLRFRDGLDALSRIFRESGDERVRIAALETIADIGSLEAGLLLIDALRQESGAVRAVAEARLRSFHNEDLLPVIRQLLDIDAVDSRPVLQAVLGRG
jgi:tetratricopeptide (TPR) repeat protein